MGIESYLQRLLPFDHLQSVVSTAKELEFRSVNLDLIYGLPGQDRDSWRRTLDTVVGWDPDRLAIYGYAHVPWAKPHQRLYQSEIETHGLATLRGLRLSGDDLLRHDVIESLMCNGRVDLDTVAHEHGLGDVRTVFSPELRRLEALQREPSEKPVSIL